jgi:DNA-binding NarL/FixJ family response regulator
VLEAAGYRVLEAASGDDAHRLLRAYPDLRVDVLFTDVAMPGLNGIEAAGQISRRNPDTAIVMLSMHSDESYVLRSLKAGARAYLLKDSAEADLIAAIQAITEGRSFFSPGVRALLKEDYIYRLQKFGADDSYELLTAREREVLQLVAEGRSNKEVASLLGLSLYTVETHRTHILQKLNRFVIPRTELTYPSHQLKMHQNAAAANVRRAQRSLDIV